MLQTAHRQCDKVWHGPDFMPAFYIRLLISQPNVIYQQEKLQGFLHTVVGRRGLNR